MDMNPPHLKFFQKPVEDRVKTLEVGSPQFDDQLWCYVTPAGAKDRLEVEWSSWEKEQQEESRKGRLPQQWLAYYQSCHKAYISGDKEEPIIGTSLDAWPMITPAKKATLHALKLRSVESVAEANEETISKMGMGGRDLNQQAKIFVSNLDRSASAAQISAKDLEIASLKERITELNAQVEALKATQGK